MFDSQSTDSGFSSVKFRETHGLIPVTLKQLSEASQSGDDKSGFVVGGVDITNVSLVGMVCSKSVRVTDVAFTLDDGTGRIDCNRWVNEGFDTKEMDDIQDGMYVRVNGRLKTLQQKKQLMAFSARPVTNFDEISFHFIDCIHFHLQSEKQLQGDASSQSQMVNSSLNTSAQIMSNAYQTALPNLSGNIAVDGVKGFEQMVLHYLQLPLNYGREKGVHRDELSQKLKLPVEKIMEAIRTLEEEGLIYSTIDEFHFKATSSG